MEKEVSKFALTISPETYVESVGKKVSDFNYKSVDASYVGNLNNSFEDISFFVKYEMLKKLRDLGGEVILNVEPSISYNNYHNKPFYMIGTALIPKK